MQVSRGAQLRHFILDPVSKEVVHSDRNRLGKWSRTPILHVGQHTVLMQFRAQTDKKNAAYNCVTQSPCFQATDLRCLGTRIAAYPLELRALDKSELALDVRTLRYHAKAM